MCSTTLSMSMYSYGCVAAVGVAVCVSCIFLYNTTIMITSAVITDNDTNRISTIVIMKIITTNEGTVSDCVVVVWTGVYSRSYTFKYKYSQLRLIGTPVNRENRLIGTNLQERNHLHRS